jgi:hypothetical protein
MIKLIDILNEIGTIKPTPPGTFNQFNGTMYEYPFKVNDKKGIVTIGNYMYSLEVIDTILGTNYVEKFKEYQNENDFLYIDEKTSKDFAQKYNIPSNIQNTYKLGFDIDSTQGTSLKMRNKSKQFHLSTLNKNLDFTNNEIEKARNGEPSKFPLPNLLQAQRNILKSIEDFKFENPSIKDYLQIIAEVASITYKFIQKYNPDILIINEKTNDIPPEVKNKRDKVYEYYFKKYNINNYTLNNKNGILYLSKK